MPATSAGAPLSSERPEEPHAYVKLWKHHAAQPWAERDQCPRWAIPCEFRRKGIERMAAAEGGSVSPRKRPSFGRVRIASWSVGEDWIVWQLTGCEVRSADFAAYKAQYSSRGRDILKMLLSISASKLTGADCSRAASGNASGKLAAALWDSLANLSCRGRGDRFKHVPTAPAVGAKPRAPGTFVGSAPGTSAAYL